MWAQSAPTARPEVLERAVLRMRAQSAPSARPEVLEQVVHRMHYVRAACLPPPPAAAYFLLLTAYLGASASMSSPSLSGVVIGARIGRLTPPAAKAPRRSRISSGAPKTNVSSIRSQGAAATAACRSFALQAATISSIRSP